MDAEPPPPQPPQLPVSPATPPGRVRHRVPTRWLGPAYGGFALVWAVAGVVGRDPARAVMGLVFGGMGAVWWRQGVTHAEGDTIVVTRIGRPRRLAAADVEVVVVPSVWSTAQVPLARLRDGSTVVLRGLDGVAAAAVAREAGVAVEAGPGPARAGRPGAVPHAPALPADRPVDVARRADELAARDVVLREQLRRARRDAPGPPRD